MVAPRRRDVVPIVLLAFATAFAVLAVGGAFRWTQAVVAVLAAAALATQLTSQRGGDYRAPLVLLLTGTAVWSAVQLLPLPGGIVQTLTPTLDALRIDGSSLAEVDAHSSLTLDPASTLRSLTLLLTLAAIAVTATRLARSSRARLWLVGVVASTCGLAALVTGIHALVGTRALYGIYVPTQASPPLLGPLLNSNHLGCLMAIGACTSLGLALYAKQRTAFRLAWTLIAIGCGVVGMACQSRGAVIATIIGIMVVAGTWVAAHFSQGERTSRRERALVHVVPAATLIACAVILATYFGAGSVVDQLEATSLDEVSDPRSKFAAWKSSLELVKESPWVGVGRGAVESTLTRVHPASSYVSFSHIENEGLQALVEWGIPATIVFTGLLAWIAVAAVRRWREGPLAAGPLGAVAAVAFQSNFDFGLELLGIAVPVVVLLATLIPAREEQPRTSSRAHLLVPRAAHLVLVLVGAVLLLLPVTRTLREDHELLRDEPTLEEIKASIERHPVDYFGFAALARHQLAQRDPAAVQALNHALRLHPTHVGLHRMAARLLARSGYMRQAAAEYAHALRGARDTRPLLQELLSVLPATHAVEAIPLALPLDATIRVLVEADRADIGLAWLVKQLEQRQDLHTAEALFSLASRSRDDKLAELAARTRCELAPNTRCRLELAQILARQGKHAEVVTILEHVQDWQGHREDRARAWLLLCDAYRAVGRVSDARFCLRRLDGSGVVIPGAAEIQQRLDVLPPTSTP